MSLTQINKAGLDEIALDHVFTVGASGTNHYTFQGEGLNGTVNDPTLYLTRGKTYRFEKGSAHPLRIQSTQGANGTAYNTGVTNNGGTGTVIIEVQHDAPDVLYYQCTSHPAMNGVLYITGALADGGVTEAKIATGAVTNGKLATDAVTTAKIANSAITNSKLGDDCVTGSRIADNAIASEHITDQSVTLAKLPHGTGSNDGKFLRANNGADPSFETVSIPAGTTINNNAANRVITGDANANTLNANSTFIYESNNSYDAKLKIHNQPLIGRSYWGWANNQSYRGTLIGRTDNTVDSTIFMGVDTTGNAGGSFGGMGSEIVFRRDHIFTTPNAANNNFVTCMRFGRATSTEGAVAFTNGLMFGNDQADANILNDYEEGAHSFTDASGASLSMSGSMYYTKIGRLVKVMFDISYPSTSSSANASVTLPYSASVAYGTGVVGWCSDPTFLHVANNTVSFMKNSASNSKHKSNSEVSGERFIGECSFFTNA